MFSPKMEIVTFLNSLFGVSKPSCEDILFLCSGTGGFTLDGDTKTAPPGKMQMMISFN